MLAGHPEYSFCTSYIVRDHSDPSKLIGTLFIPCGKLEIDQVTIIL